jgi:hypothetical protein
VTYWQTAFFKKLQQAWYAKLEASGFVDAEEQVQGEMVLRQSATPHSFRDGTATEVTARAEYYQVLGEMVEAFEFDSEIDRTILTMFAEGAKIRSICEALSRGIPSLRQRRRRCRGTVRFTIRKYEMQWGLRKYSPRELNQREPRRIAS